MTTVRIERDFVTVEMIDPREPDPKWVFVDAAGHEHRWVGDKVPTLETKIIGEWFCPDCQDLHEDVVSVCAQCEDVVEPQTRPGEHVQRIPTLTHYFVDDVEVTKEEAEAAIASIKP